MKQEALDRGVATIAQELRSRRSRRGKLKQDKYEQRMSLLSTTLELRRPRRTPTW